MDRRAVLLFATTTLLSEPVAHALLVPQGLPSLPGGGDGKAAADVVAARRWVYAELQRVLASERAQREALWRDGTTASMRIPPHNKDDRIGEEEVSAAPQGATCHTCAASQ